jgi:hypothetical protein
LYKENCSTMEREFEELAAEGMAGLLIDVEVNDLLGR